ncbi:hypothetical protein F2P81_003128 [Scophthalmus maximus]|uniref:Uncharacterized protein n=1 Tax=Scophthalmus maximus TaxID=52904 RepID=A0A6A4TJZ5_SCOMX|nr:hypothetical protein F2P81_003128 [Scophthalmus maximus]
MAKQLYRHDPSGVKRSGESRSSRRSSSSTSDNTDCSQRFSSPPLPARFPPQYGSDMHTGPHCTQTLFSPAARQRAEAAVTSAALGADKSRR